MHRASQSCSSTFRYSGICQGDIEKQKEQSRRRSFCWLQEYIFLPILDLLKILNNVQSVQYPAHNMHCNMEKHILFWHQFSYDCYSVVCTLYTWLECAYVWYMYKLLLAAQTMKFSAGCHARCFTFDAMLHETSSLPSDLGPSWPARRDFPEHAMRSSKPQSTHEKLGK